MDIQFKEHLIQNAIFVMVLIKRHFWNILQVRKSPGQEVTYPQKNMLLREAGNQTERPNNETERSRISPPRQTNGSLHILPGQKTSTAKIMSLNKNKETNSGNQN